MNQFYFFLSYLLDSVLEIAMSLNSSLSICSGNYESFFKSCSLSYFHDTNIALSPKKNVPLFFGNIKVKYNQLLSRYNNSYFG